MEMTFANRVKPLLALRWKPGKDLLAVFVSYLLVVGALYTATVIVGPATGGGLPYFFLYAVLTATLLGVGVPLGWTVLVRKRPLSDLGISPRWLGLSLGLQVVFAGLEIYGAYRGLKLPPLEKLLPLIALSLTIGFFEAVFWRGWVLNRLEEAFGFIPAAVIGSVLYAVYHVGYAMPLNEIIFLFFIGLMYAAAFRITGSIFILWPLFQPAGQIITLVKDGLDLPLIASVGFLEALIVMGVLVWLASRRAKKIQPKTAPAA